MANFLDFDVDDDPVFEPSYDPYREQDLQPWEREFESRYAFDPESEEA